MLKTQNSSYAIGHQMLPTRGTRLPYRKKRQNRYLFGLSSSACPTSGAFALPLRGSELQKGNVGYVLL